MTVTHVGFDNQHQQYFAAGGGGLAHDFAVRDLFNFDSIGFNSSSASDNSDADMAELPPLPVLGVSADIDDLSCEDSIVILDANPLSTMGLGAEVTEADLAAVGSLNWAQIHKKVYSEARVPELFVDKLVAFHCGHLSLTVDDLTSYFMHLDKTFSKFAYHLKEFRDLSENDRSALLLANAPLYFQLHMCRYMNSGEGLAQVKSLLGASLPEDVRGCDKLLTVSFRYFASAIRLFNDPIWTDRYEVQAEAVKRSSFVNAEFDDGSLGFHSLAAAILFNMNTGSFLDDPDKVRRLFTKSFKKSAASQVKGGLDILKTMVHCYSGNSTITRTGAKFRNTTKVSLSSMPVPNISDDEEQFWLDRQLRICYSRGRDEVSLSSEAINDLALNINDEHTVEDNATANTANGNILNIVADVIAKRCHVYFWCHHEYRQLYKPSNPNAEDEKVVAEVCETFNANVGKAVAFLLAYMDSLGLANEQLKFILNNNDLKMCPKIPSNKRLLQLFSSSSSEVLKGYGVTSEMMTSMVDWITDLGLSESEADVGDNFHVLAALSLLFHHDLQPDHAPGFVSQVVGIRDRYQLLLKNFLTKKVGLEEANRLHSALLKL